MMVDLNKELERANTLLDEQLAKSNFVTRGVARRLVRSKHREHIKSDITHGTNFLQDILQKL